MSKIDKDALVAEIERLKAQLIRGACSAQIEMETNCKDEAYNEVLSFIYSLPDEPVSEDLEKEVKKYFQGQWSELSKGDSKEWSEYKRIKKEIRTLYNEIDSCIDELLKARTNKNTEEEGKALFRMEGLMVGTLQDLSYIDDWLNSNKDEIQ